MSIEKNTNPDQRDEPSRMYGSDMWVWYVSWRAAAESVHMPLRHPRYLPGALRFSMALTVVYALMDVLLPTPKCKGRMALLRSWVELLSVEVVEGTCQLLATAWGLYPEARYAMRRMAHVHVLHEGGGPCSPERPCVTHQTIEAVVQLNLGSRADMVVYPAASAVWTLLDLATDVICDVIVLRQFRGGTGDDVAASVLAEIEDELRIANRRAYWRRFW